MSLKARDCNKCLDEQQPQVLEVNEVYGLNDSSEDVGFFDEDHDIENEHIRKMKNATADYRKHNKSRAETEANPKSDIDEFMFSDGTREVGSPLSRNSEYERKM